MTKKPTEDVVDPTVNTEEVPVEVVQPKQAFAFPELGKTIEAESLEEAQKQL